MITEIKGIDRPLEENMKAIEIITAVRYMKKHGEYVITARNANTGKTSKTYANSLTENEIVFAKSSKYCFEDDICVAWVN